ncbi:hypothetical protein HMPREF6123_2402, partial [Oribacterium sinus F0268]
DYRPILHYSLHLLIFQFFTSQDFASTRLRLLHIQTYIAENLLFAAPFFVLKNATFPKMKKNKAIPG